MSGSITSAMSAASVKNLDDSAKAVVYSAVLSLVANVPFALNLTEQNNVYPRQIKGAFVDNSAGTAGCTVMTLAGDNKTIPSGSQGTMPLFVGPDDTLYITGAGTVRITLMNFDVNMAVWSATGSGSGVSVGEGYGPSDEVVYTRNRNTFASGKLASGLTNIFSGECYLDAILLQLSAASTVSGGGIVSWALEGNTAGSSVVQSTQSLNQEGSNIGFTFSNPTTVGNKILVILTWNASYSSSVTVPSGWTIVGALGGVNGVYYLVYETTVTQAAEAYLGWGYTATGMNFAALELENVSSFDLNVTGYAFAATNNSPSNGLSSATINAANTGTAFRVVFFFGFTSSSLTATPTGYGAYNVDLVGESSFNCTVVGTFPSTGTVVTISWNGGSVPSSEDAVVIDCIGTSVNNVIASGDVYVPGTASVSGGVVTLMDMQDMKLAVPGSGLQLAITSGTLSAGGIYYTALGGLTALN